MSYLVLQKNAIIFDGRGPSICLSRWKSFLKEFALIVQEAKPAAKMLLED